MKKKATRPGKPRTIVLSRKEYGKLYRLARWYQDTPEEVEMGEGTEEMVHALMDSYLGAKIRDDQSAVVELSGAALVAVIEDENSHETRVPILERRRRQ